MGCQDGGAALGASPPAAAAQEPTSPVAASRWRRTAAEQVPPTLKLRSGFAQGEDGDDESGHDDFDDLSGAVDDDDFADSGGPEGPESCNTFVAPVEAVALLDLEFFTSVEDELSSAMDKTFPCDDGERNKLSSVEGQPFLTERRYVLKLHHFLSRKLTPWP